MKISSVTRDIGNFEKIFSKIRNSYDRVVRKYVRLSALIALVEIMAMSLADSNVNRLDYNGNSCHYIEASCSGTL
jgi:hypothetical protein